MNGPDLRFLAERASVLEDRTAERLGQVHGRIAVARERRRAATALGAAGLVVAVFVGLAVVQRGQDRSSPDPADQSTPTVTDGFGDAAPPPPTGTCWAVAPELVGDPNHTSDDSRQVPCTEPHTTETVATFVLGEPTTDEAKARFSTCWQIALNFLGVDPASWTPWWAFQYLPSEQQIADGASWVRCDVSVPDTWSIGWHSRTVTRSLAGIADAPHPELWVCLAQPPAEDQPFVSCDQPHAYESTGTLALAPDSATYPSTAEFASMTQEQCRDDVPDRLAGASVTAVWDTKESTFDLGLPVAGPCFVFNEDGSLLPPR